MRDNLRDMRNKTQARAFSDELNATIYSYLDALQPMAGAREKAYLEVILAEQQILSADKAAHQLVRATYVLAACTIALVGATLTLAFAG